MLSPTVTSNVEGGVVITVASVTLKQNSEFSLVVIEVLKRQIIKNAQVSKRYAVKLFFLLSSGLKSNKMKNVLLSYFPQLQYIKGPITQCQA